MPSTSLKSLTKNGTLAHILTTAGHVDNNDLETALNAQKQQKTTLDKILLAKGMVKRSDLEQAIQTQWHIDKADIKNHPPDKNCIEHIGVSVCLDYDFVPLQSTGTKKIIATSNPNLILENRSVLIKILGNTIVTYAPKADIHNAILSVAGDKIVHCAETELEYTKSCRSIPKITGIYLCLGIIALYGLMILLHDSVLQNAPFLVLVLFISINIVLKLSILITAVQVLLERIKHTCRDAWFCSFDPNIMLPYQLNKRAQEARLAKTENPDIRLPTMSILIPLLREENIVDHLLEKLHLVRYPRSLLSVIILLEQGDIATLNALHKHVLPEWIRILVIPKGTFQSKPRALNYAFTMCDSEIIGVYDAEDAPEPNQLYTVARQFRLADPKVVCLQGIVDFYNTNTNWLSRCFTIEYAAWFRAILPGLENLGFPVPLGGTTFFVRKHPLKIAGKWDTYNVTEDIDLGIRLARAGYKTATMKSITFEEANYRLVSWIKQRSRWLKGYIMTWLMHSKNPIVCIRELGWKQFLGIQIFFIGTLTSQIVTPLLFFHLFLIFVLDINIFINDQLWLWHAQTIVLTVVLATVLDFVIKIYGICIKRQIKLLLYFPLLYLYYPLSLIAFVRATLQIIRTPFFWDKTEHGLNLPLSVPKEKNQQAEQ